MLGIAIAKGLEKDKEVVKGRADVITNPTKEDLVRTVEPDTKQKQRRMAAELKPKKKTKKVSKMKRINLQVTPEDYNQIKDIADFNGISISTLLRNSALGRGRILRKID